MKVDALTQKAEEEISALIAKKIAELRKKTGQEVSEIEFIAREAMTGLEGYEVKSNSCKRFFLKWSLNSCRKREPGVMPGCIMDNHRLYERINVSISAFMVSACVVCIPCGKPG